MAKTSKIGVLRLVRLQAVLMSLVGLLAGILYSFGGAVYDVITTGSVNGGTVLAFLALLGMPLVFAAGGAILGFVQAVLFNLFVKRFGGIEVELAQ